MTPRQARLEARLAQLKAAGVESGVYYERLLAAVEQEREQQRQRRQAK